MLITLINCAIKLCKFKYNHIFRNIYTFLQKIGTAVMNATWEQRKMTKCSIILKPSCGRVLVTWREKMLSGKVMDQPCFQVGGLTCWNTGTNITIIISSLVTFWLVSQHILLPHLFNLLQFYWVIMC